MKSNLLFLFVVLMLISCQKLTEDQPLETSLNSQEQALIISEIESFVGLVSTYEANGLSDIALDFQLIASRGPESCNALLTPLYAKQKNKDAIEAYIKKIGFVSPLDLLQKQKITGEKLKNISDRVGSQQAFSGLILEISRASGISYDKAVSTYFAYSISTYNKFKFFDVSDFPRDMLAEGLYGPTSVSSYLYRSLKLTDNEN